jgi:DNA topoisomerase-3
LTDAKQPRSVVEKKLRMDETVFEKALEKLYIHGGADIDPAENVSRGEPGWRKLYIEQRRHKMQQLEQISRYADSHACRMLSLLEYFGDVDDLETSCGVCDICAAGNCALVQYRAPTAKEKEVLEGIVEALREQDRQAVGRLYSAGLWEGDLDRREFEKLLGALARCGLVRLSVETFEKGGQSIEYRRASLTPEIRGLEGSVADAVQIPAERPQPPRKLIKRPPKGKKAAGAKTAGTTAAGAKTAAAKGTAAPARAPRAQALLPDAPPDEIHEALLAALKAWRLDEARRRGVPAFQILTDRAIKAIASQRPAGEEELLNVHGIGPRLARKYGKQILKIVAAAT